VETKHREMINKAIRNVPSHLRDDTFQAGCVGLVKGLQRADGTENPDGYVYSCIRSEVLKELASLHSLYAIDVRTLINLSKYKRAKAYGLEPSSQGLKPTTVEQLERILSNKGR
jgi:DNA-directed RNA polymerase specialized sigma subunit